MGVQKYQHFVYNLSTDPDILARNNNALTINEIISHNDESVRWGKKQAFIRSIDGSINSEEINQQYIRPSLVEVNEKNEVKKDALKFVAIGSIITFVPVLFGCGANVEQVVEEIKINQKDYKVTSEADIVKQVSSNIFRATGYLQSVSLDESQKNCTITLVNYIDEVPFVSRYSTAFSYPNIAMGFAASFDDIKNKFNLSHLVADVYFEKGMIRAVGVNPSNIFSNFYNPETQIDTKKLLILRDGMNAERTEYAAIGLNKDNNVVDVGESYNKDKFPFWNEFVTPGQEYIFYTRLDKDTNKNIIESVEKLVK
jgi:hypothetical protein